MSIHKVTNELMREGDWVLAVYSQSHETTCVYHECDWSVDDQTDWSIWENASKGACCICREKAPESLVGLWYLHNFDELSK